MGKRDNKRTPKMKRRRGQVRKKNAVKKRIKAGSGATGVKKAVAAPKAASPGVVKKAAAPKAAAAPKKTKE